MPTDRIEGLTTERFASILSVALDEFASARYHDASFNRIIKNCNMAKGTMYYYFKSKEDLFLTIHKATLRDFRNLAVLTNTQTHSAEEFWSLTEELLFEFYRTLYRKPSASQFVTNFLTQASRTEGHPAIATVNAIDDWLKDLLHHGQTLGAVRSDLNLEQVATLAWGIWESCRSWFPSEANRMQTSVHPDTILDLFRRALAPMEHSVDRRLPETETSVDPSIEAAFSGASREDLAAEPLEHTQPIVPYSEDEMELESETDQKIREDKIAHLLASFKVPL